MWNFECGVIAEHRYIAKYEVFCNRCNTSIGVMDFSTIRQAIFNTIARGGILCPPCRGNTCDMCGAVARYYAFQDIIGPKGRVRVCPGCDAHMQELTVEIEQEISGPDGKDWSLDDLTAS